MQTQPYRDLTTEEISEFRSSGVACLRQVVDPGKLIHLNGGIEFE